MAGVTFAELLPRMYHPQRRVEVDGGAAPPADSARGHAREQRLGGRGLLRACWARRCSPGRAFHAGDLEPGRAVVVVNESFVGPGAGRPQPHRPARALPAPRGRGRRRRRTRSRARGYEIVGVVPDLGMTMGGRRRGRGDLPPGRARAPAAPLYLAVHVRGDAGGVRAAARALAAAVDPTLRLYDVLPLDHCSATCSATYTSGSGGAAGERGGPAPLDWRASTRSCRSPWRGARGRSASAWRWARTGGASWRAIFSRPLAQVGLGIARGRGPAWSPGGRHPAHRAMAGLLRPASR